jgi:hypothetical protein
MLVRKTSISVLGFSVTTYCKFLAHVEVKMQLFENAKG